jgi:hypothetical protein
LPNAWPALSPAQPTLFDDKGSLDRALLRAEIVRRAEVYWLGGVDAEFRAYCLDQARRDVCWFFDNFVWTLDPRLKAYIPMVIWPRQREYLKFVEERVEAAEDFAAEKSRDVGVTYLNCGLATQKWRFDAGWKTSFCANKLDLVDQRGNPDSIFEKIRGIIEGMPKWALPPGYRASRHDREAKIINPASRNIMTGEGGDNAGRGGRSTLYVLDEAAHIDRADSVNAATSANARTRGWTSSVNGNGNLFYRLTHDGEIPVFRFHWRDDPRKNDEWAEKTRRKLGPETFAQEFDLDYGASITGLAIPSAWIDAARELYRRMPDVVENYRAKKGIGGWDIGGGKAESVVIGKWGPVIGKPHARRDPDSVDVAFWALDYARENRLGLLNYDSVGLGYAMGSILARAATLDVQIEGVNVGVPPTARVWPDERTSQEKFTNLKAELWGRAREAFQRSWLLLRHLQGDPEGIDYPVDEVILLAEDDDLARQLSTPKRFRNEAGKIMIETKEQLAKRGVKSPDRAEAAILSFHDQGDGPLFYVGVA